MAATSFMRTWQDFDLIQLVVLPMFLFSGTFYPIDAYPAALRLVVQLTPLYQGVDLLRSLAVGISTGPARPRRVPGDHGHRRAVRRLAPARQAAAEVAGPRGVPTAAALAALTAEIVACRGCPRLVAWREQVAREKVARFRDETYWGRPVPGFGDPDARILVVGLAPAAHGGNRTGRVFTGDALGRLPVRGDARGRARQPADRPRAPTTG